MAMELQADGHDLLQRYKPTGCLHQQLSVAADRLMNASVQMMASRRA